MRTESLTGNPLLIVAPLGIWAGHFLFAYVVTALACARPVAPALLHGTLIGATVLALAAVAGTGWLCRRHSRFAGSSAERRLVLRAGSLVSIIAFIAVLWMALVMLFVAPCE